MHTVGPLSDDLVACAPPAAEAWIETGRARDGAAEYVLAEPESSGPTAEFEPALLRISAGACRGHYVYETDGGADDPSPPPSATAWDELLDGSFAWHVRESGGVEAFAEIQRRSAGGELAECPPDEDLGLCLQSWLAERLRSAGVAVGPTEF